MKIAISTDDLGYKDNNARLLALDLFNGEPDDLYVYYKNTEIYNIDNVRDYHVKEEDGRYVLKVNSEGFSNFFVDYFEDVKRSKNKSLFFVDDFNNKAFCLSGIRPIRFDDMYFDTYLDYRFINQYEVTFVLKDYFSIRDLVEYPVYKSNVKFKRLYVDLKRVRNDVFVYLYEKSFLMGHVIDVFVHINDSDYPYVDLYIKDEDGDNMFVSRQFLKYYDVPVYHFKVYDDEDYSFRVEFNNKLFVKNKHLNNVCYTVDGEYWFEKI
ncbi:MAG: hypothetical protein QXF12_03965 [Candidatus Aenigmatarchaeota archaeon]